MPMTRRPARTLVFMGLSETHAIGWYAAGTLLPLEAEDAADAGAKVPARHGEVPCRGPARAVDNVLEDRGIGAVGVDRGELGGA